MKKRINSWMFAVTLIYGAMTLTGCQGLIDAIIGDYSDNSATTTSATPTTPTTPIKFDAKTTPLTFEAQLANTVVTINLMEGIALSSVEYCTDGTTWISLSTNPQKITLADVGDNLMLRGSNGSYASADGATTITCTSGVASTRGLSSIAYCKVYGNIMSLIKKDGFASLKELNQAYTFKNLFKGGGIDTDNNKRLILPATTLTMGCYEGMFANNNTLKFSPILPAPTLVSRCYLGMFAGCSRLQSVTILSINFEIGAEDPLKGWLADAGTDTESGEAPTLIVAEGSEIPIEELTIDAGDENTNWIVEVKKPTSLGMQAPDNFTDGGNPFAND